MGVKKTLVYNPALLITTAKNFIVQAPVDFKPSLVVGVIAKKIFSSSLMTELSKLECFPFRILFRLVQYV